MGKQIVDIQQILTDVADVDSDLAVTDGKVDTVDTKCDDIAWSVLITDGDVLSVEDKVDIVTARQPRVRDAFSVTKAANDGASTVATVSGGDIAVWGVTLKAALAFSSDFTEGTVHLGEIQVFRSYEFKYSYMSTQYDQIRENYGNAPLILTSGESLDIDLTGTGSGAVSFDIYLTWTPLDVGAAIS